MNPDRHHCAAGYPVKNSLPGFPFDSGPFSNVLQLLAVVLVLQVLVVDKIPTSTYIDKRHLYIYTTGNSNTVPGLVLSFRSEVPL